MFAIKSSGLAAIALGTVLVSACGGDLDRSGGPIGPSPSIAPTAAVVGGDLRATATGATGGADLQMSGSASTGSPDASAPLTYTFLLKNSGPEAAAAVTVSDVLPVGAQYVGASVPAFSGLGGPIGCNAVDDGTAVTVTCGLGTMSKGGQATVSVVVRAPATAGTFSNTAAATSATADPNPANNSVTVTAQVKTSPAGAACPLPANQTTLHGIVMWTGSISSPSGQLIQNFAFTTDSGVMYWVETNFYDGSAPLTTVINLDCKQSPVQFIAVGGSVSVTGTFGTDTVQLFPPSAGVPPVPTLIASVVQVPTHKDKI